MAEASTLKVNGFLLISFDCRLNLFNELYHRLFTRKLYPEWTLTPSEIRTQLQSLGFTIIREHAIFVAGFFWGTHRPIFPLARILHRKRVFEFLTQMELSRHSPFLSFIAPQYVIIARKMTLAHDWRVTFRAFRSIVPEGSKNWRLSIYSHISAKLNKPSGELKTSQHRKNQSCGPKHSWIVWCLEKQLQIRSCFQLVTWLLQLY